MSSNSTAAAAAASKRRLYQPRAVMRATVNAAIAVHRMNPQRSPRETALPVKSSLGAAPPPPVTRLSTDQSSDKTTQSVSSAASTAPANAASPTDGNDVGKTPAASQTASPPAVGSSNAQPNRIIVREKDRANAAKQGSSRKRGSAVIDPASVEDIVPLPGPQSSINDFTVLPITGKKVLQTLIYCRLERPETSAARRFLLGPQMEWKRRFMRVVSVTPGKERIEVYRTERRRGEHPTIKELIYNFPLSALEHVHPQYLEQSSQLQFEHFDYDSKKVTQEYVYGHIRMVLIFAAAECPSMELCCTSSAERDAWVDYLVGYICKRERVDLLEYQPVQYKNVSIPLQPQEGVQRFTSTFLSGAQQRFAAAKEAKGGATNPFVNSDLEPISRTERSTSALRWTVLVSTSVISRKQFNVECARLGIFSLDELGEFAVESAHMDNGHADTFYVKPEDPSVAKVLGLYLNDDKMIEVRTLQDSKKFWVWLMQCFGVNAKGFQRSFHSPNGSQWSSRRSADAVSQLSDNNTSFALDGRGHSPNIESTSSDGGVPFFKLGQTKKDAYEASMRRVESVVIQKRKLNALARRAITQPSTFDWHQMATLAYVEYNVIGGPPTPESSYKKRVVALDSTAKRLYVLGVPPDHRVVLDLPVNDVAYISGYSDVYGDSGFTMHLFRVGLEINVVPLREEARRMWNVALRFCWQTEHLLRDMSREAANAQFLGVPRDEMELDGLCVAHAQTVCALCGRRKYGALQCSVSGLQHAEYLKHVKQAQAAYGSGLAAMPVRNVRCPTDVNELLERTRKTLERSRLVAASLCGQPL